jgi:acyl-CoA reductase-like NAD-dependent aldehyde dehydrogenase
MAEQVTRDETKLLIGGRWVEAGDGTYDIINPATEGVVGQAPNASVEDARAAAAAAAEAFPAWAATPVEERLALLKKASAAIQARNDDLVPLVIAETGATARVGSRMQVPVSAARFDRYSRDISHVQERSLNPVATAATPLAPGGLVSALVYRQPVGVVAAIASYNFPLTNMAGKVAPALAMGNTVIMKPAPQDPLAVIELARILDEVGFPPGVVNIINSAGPEPAAVLTETPDVDMVSFTGSTSVGQRIAASGAQSMKRLLMELGGKGAAVVFEDADVKTAATAIASTFGFHSGQICTAPTRAVIHRSKFEEIVEALGAAAAFMQVGDPTDTKTIVGPVISGIQQQRILDHIETGRKEGEIAFGGGRPAHLETGYYIEPTLVIGTNDITVAREEIFGPVVVAIPFDDEEEGIAIANDSDFGLYDYVFSGDSARAFRVAKQLRAGHVGINTAQRNMEAPFGGFKLSGIGRDGGEFGLEAYSEVQSIIWAG